MKLCQSSYPQETWKTTKIDSINGSGKNTWRFLRLMSLPNHRSILRRCILLRSSWTYFAKDILKRNQAKLFLSFWVSFEEWKRQPWIKYQFKHLYSLYTCVKIFSLDQKWLNWSFHFSIHAKTYRSLWKKTSCGLLGRRFVKESSH